MPKESYVCGHIDGRRDKSITWCQYDYTTISITVLNQQD